MPSPNSGWIRARPLLIHYAPSPEKDRDCVSKGCLGKRVAGAEEKSTLGKGEEHTSNDWCATRRQHTERERERVHSFEPPRTRRCVCVCALGGRRSTNNSRRGGLHMWICLRATSRKLHRGARGGRCMPEQITAAAGGEPRAHSSGNGRRVEPRRRSSMLRRSREAWPASRTARTHTQATRRRLRRGDMQCTWCQSIVLMCVSACRCTARACDFMRTHCYSLHSTAKLPTTVEAESPKLPEEARAIRRMPLRPLLPHPLGPAAPPRPHRQSLSCWPDDMGSSIQALQAEILCWKLGLKECNYIHWTMAKLAQPMRAIACTPDRTQFV